MANNFIRFTAPCPECGEPAIWNRSSSDNGVKPGDFRIECECRSTAEAAS